MKQALLILVFGISFNQVNAQFADKHAIYAAEEFDIGNYLGGDLNLNYVFAESYSIKVGYSGHIRKPKSQPEKYTSGLIGNLLLNLADPYDQIENYQLLVGKIYSLNKKNTIRANVSLGLGYTTIREPGNWQPVNEGFLTENYTYEYSKSNTVSLIINPKIEFPFTRFYGLTISPMLQINKDRTYFGVGIGQMIGLLRKRKINHNNGSQT